MERRLKISCPFRESNPVAMPTELSKVPSIFNLYVNSALATQCLQMALRAQRMLYLASCEKCLLFAPHVTSSASMALCYHRSGSKTRAERAAVRMLQSLLTDRFQRFTCLSMRQYHSELRRRTLGDFNAG
jgi:hypothetical protein